MKIKRVQYTVKQDFVAKNKQNIAKVMTELKGLNNNDTKYFSSVASDGNTFMHIVMHKSGSDESLPSNLDSFKSFQDELKQNLEISPKAETFELVDSSFDIF